ncbi:hypothetical protein DFH29DRAFT_807023, partial [Suillus ampliporus]
LLFSIPLPDELIDSIIDAASYWAHTSVTVNRAIHAYGIGCGTDIMYVRTLPLARLVFSGLPPTESNWVAPTRAKPFRKIEFQLWSHGRGWLSEHCSRRGTYEGSYTWFDASVERLDRYFISHGKHRVALFIALHCSRCTDAGHPFLPSPTTLQKNIVASNQPTHHIVTWTDLDNVKEGSPEAIAAESRGQGWKSYDGSFIRDLQVGDCITLWTRAHFPGWIMKGVKAKITVYWAV